MYDQKSTFLIRNFPVWVANNLKLADLLEQILDRKLCEAPSNHQGFWLFWITDRNWTFLRHQTKSPIPIG